MLLSVLAAMLKLRTKSASCSSLVAAGYLLQVHFSFFQVPYLLLQWFKDILICIGIIAITI
jgi:hypothetical protein